jgi:glucokinase
VSTVEIDRTQSFTMNELLGFDIGGTKCAAVLGRAMLGQPPQILAREAFATHENPAAKDVFARLSSLAGAMMKNCGVDKSHVANIGISCGGPLDSRSGIVCSPPNLPGWDSVPVTQIVENTLGIPACLQNDANACGLAEWHWGAARGTQTAIFLTFGTGLGAGLIIGGRLHAGCDDLAGEVGHWRLADEGPLGFGKRGSFEGFCSGGGIERLAATLAMERGIASQKLPDLASSARKGDPFAREIFSISGDKLGRGLALLIDLLNPEVIVIGSVYVRCKDLLRPAMERALAAEGLPPSVKRCRIIPAALGEQIGDYASLAVALREL